MARWKVRVLFLLSVTLGKCLAQTSELELTPAERIAPGEDVYINLFPNVYGNNVTRRDLHLPAGGDKVWIDREITLQPGSLLRFFVYIHNFTMFSNHTEYLRLQIWRATDLEEERFMLVYQIRVAIRANPPTIGTLYSFRPKDKFAIKYQDRMGWTCEGSVCPISFEYTEGHRTLFTSYDPSNMPEVNDVIQFNEIFLPTIFSVAVEVTPRIIAYFSKHSRYHRHAACASGVADPCHNEPRCNQLCQSTNGSMQCGCIDGFHLADGELYNCTDINECESATALCNQRCVNIPGHYYCACALGYHLGADLHTCIKDESGISVAWIAFIVNVGVALVFLAVIIAMVVRKKRSNSSGSNQVTITGVLSTPDDQYGKLEINTMTSVAVDRNEKPQDSDMKIATATDDGCEFPVKEDVGYSRLK